jgi:cytoskeleton protein RodZ
MPKAAEFESPAEIGAYLARLRVEQGKSIANAASYLKVAPSKLEAIEAGDMARLPDATFAVGLVRSYAKMLGVDSDRLFPALKTAYGVQVPELSLPVSSGVQLSRRRIAMNWRDSASRRGGWHNGWLLGCVLAAIAAVLLLVWRNGREAPGWLTHQFKATSSSAVHEEVSPVEKEKALPSAADRAENVAQVPVEALGEAGHSEAAANTTSAAIADADSAQAMAASSALTAVSVAASASNTASLDTSALVTPATQEAQGMSVVTMDVAQKCWVSVQQQDGRSVFEGIVQPGQTQPIRGFPPFKIVLGNQQAVKNIWIDGKLVEPQRYAGHANIARFTLLP